MTKVLIEVKHENCYRNVVILFEHLPNRILDDLKAGFKPRWMVVAGDFAAKEELQ